jgi:hypothetical protein
LPEPVACPACAGRLFPRELECADCGLRVQTGYRGSEFTSLGDDDLHVLRIFIACEGRIRDMEAALGVSYPTVKSRLATLRRNLGFDEAQAVDKTPAPDGAPDDASASPRTIREVLDLLEQGAIDFDESMRLIKQRRGA